jgi:hypothetical protein
MLVTRREPTFEPGAHDPSWQSRHEHAHRPDHGHAPMGHVPRAARLATVLQLVGSLIALPVGLASAYSIYRANFSIETTCQSLRTDIVSLIDKKIDAPTRRMLVRRDVESFEKTCGSVDPDAAHAFKALLAAEKAVPAAAPRVEPSVKAAKDVPPKDVPSKEAVVKEAQPKEAPAKDAPAKEAARKPAPHPAAAAKQPAPAAASAPAAEAQHEAAVTSDARWLDAVRGALVTHAPIPADVVAPAPVRSAAPETQVLGKVPAPAPQPAAAQPSVAPTLPPATNVPAAPAPEAPNHPVPPGSIPDGNAPQGETNGSQADRQSSSNWISNIPLLGKAFE